MSDLSPNLYAQWRRQSAGPDLLRDSPPSPPERLLQHVWQHQRLQADRLLTLDGKPVRVLHPGFWNYESGPDFRGAVIQLGGAAPVSGDVEIDRQAADWFHHGHDRNPAYAGVILHVIWDGAAAAAGALPTLALESRLDAPLAELSAWASGEVGPSGALNGQCSAPLRGLAPAITDELLRQAAQIRLQRKAADFEAAARQSGWEGALWEGLFGALGYKHNFWPMRRLAMLRPRYAAAADSGAEPVLALQARLLGLSGLLPADLERVPAAPGEYLRRIWDHWWRERDQFADDVLPRSLWRFNGLRPANHPQRRLALAAHWLASGSLPERLERWFLAPAPDHRLGASLLEILQVERDDFWSWHWTLRSRRLPRAQPLLGAQRATDLAINVILPWLWMRAVAGRNDALRAVAERRYFAWPKAEDNAVLKLARRRLLGPGSARALKTAAEQQGLLQIVRDFCDHSNAVCEQCPFPELVRSIPTPQRETSDRLENRATPG